MPDMKDRKRIAIWIIFSVYCFFMVYLLFFNGRNNYQNYSFSEYVANNTNFILFHYINGYVRNMIAGERLFEAVINLVGNVVMFVPIGLLLPLAVKRLSSFRSFIICSLCIPLVIESIQLVFMVGCFDVDDIVLNVIGQIIGYGLYILIRGRKEKG